MVGRQNELHAALQKFRGDDVDVSGEQADIQVLTSLHCPFFFHPVFGINFEVNFVLIP